MTHAKEFRFRLSHGLLVEEQRTTMEPIRAWLLIVPERQPQVLELAHFFVVVAAPQVDHVCDAQGLQLLYVPPGCNGTAKRQPLAYPKHAHTVAPFVRT